MPPNPRFLRAIRHEFRVYFHAVLVPSELVGLLLHLRLRGATTVRPRIAARTRHTPRDSAQQTVGERVGTTRAARMPRSATVRGCRSRCSPWTSWTTSACAYFSAAPCSFASSTPPSPRVPSRREPSDRQAGRWSGQLLRRRSRTSRLYSCRASGWTSRSPRDRRTGGTGGPRGSAESRRAVVVRYET